ncbi:hypothetical protein E0K89_000845 [Aquicoccus sp. SCR17]|nr:hypothetical protein [Carideicomes alvinocaridis]
MSLIKIRKRALIAETVYHELGPAPEEPLRLAAAMAVITNPFAGRYASALPHSSKVPLTAPFDGLRPRLRGTTLRHAVWENASTRESHERRRDREPMVSRSRTAPCVDFRLGPRRVNGLT